MKAKISLILSVVFTVCVINNSNAQNNKPSRHFEIEIDPTAYLLNGYSVHLGYQVNHLRFDAGVFGLSQPSFFLNNDKFKDRSSGFGIKADYIFNKQKGLLVGIQSDYNNGRLTLKPNGSSVVSSGITAGIRTGYRIMLGKRRNWYKGIYLMPWAALIYSPSAKDIMIKEQILRQSKFTLFPTLHIGYRF